MSTATEVPAVMSEQLEAALERAEARVAREVQRALAEHPRPYNSAHEGYAVVKEELDEMWEAVRANDRKAAVAEAAQVAATAIRFIAHLEHPDG